MHPSVYSNIIYNQDLEATWVSADRWVDKEDKVYWHNGILLSCKKEWNLAICDTDGPRGNDAKWNELDRERQIPYDCSYLQNLQKT